MISRVPLRFLRLVVVALVGPTVAAQTPSPALRGGVPTGEASTEEIPLTLDDAIARGLQHNLGLLLAHDSVESARGDRREALADLLPQLRGGLSASRQKISTAAFGFAGVGDFPTIIGPFDVFDARAYASQAILDLHALGRSRARAESLKAAEHEERNTRDLVVLACAQLYLQAVSAQSRIGAARARLATAQALSDLASDRKASGLAAGIDVLRAQVERETERQRVIVAENDAAKKKLELARAIGLPLGQPFRVADGMPRGPAPEITPEEALKLAYEARADLRAAEARVRAAEESRKAAKGEGLPSLGVSGDFGAIGNDVGGSRTTFTMAAGVKIPIFEGGRVQARVEAADARLRQERASLADLRARIYYEVQSVFLDLKASEDRVDVADRASELAEQQLQQAKDRFAAGVTGNIDVVQAQEVEARATEDRIDSLFGLNLAKAALARTLGAAETGYSQFLRGSK
jgi:outer membrane protein TolC